jgi:arylsulfatase
MIGLPQGESPLLPNTSCTVMADAEVPAGAAAGMSLSCCGRFGGCGLYLLKGKPVRQWNLVDLDRLKCEGTEALAFNDFSGVGRPGTGTLKVDGKVVDTKPLPRALPVIPHCDEGFDIGSNTLTVMLEAPMRAND